MSKRKVTLRVKTVGKQVGDVIEVDSETADQLIADRQALPVKPGPKPEKD
jgi:hypothetical protein